MLRTLLRLGAMLFVQLVKIMDRHTLILPAYSQEESTRSFAQTGSTPTSPNVIKP